MEEKWNSIFASKTASGTTTEHAQTATTFTPPTTTGKELVVLMCIYHAYFINVVHQVTCQATLSAGLKLNGLPDIKLPPNPPAAQILQLASNKYGSMKKQANQKQAEATTQQTADEGTDEESTQEETLHNIDKPTPPPHRNASSKRESSHDDEERAGVSETVNYTTAPGHPPKRTHTTQATTVPRTTQALTSTSTHITSLSLPTSPTHAWTRRHKTEKRQWRHYVYCNTTY